MKNTLGKVVLLMLVTLTAFVSYADTYTLTKNEKLQILNEAEDWIDDMPEGLQERLSDAVNHSLRGFFSELEYFRNIGDTTGIGKYNVSVKNIQGGLNSNVPMRIYKGKKVKTSKLPLLIYFHGGGWSMGSLETSEKFCRALASEGNVIVVSVSYPLAPEYSYPAAIDLCKAASEYIVSKAEEWGSNKNLISLGGDGAGGNLALSVYQKLPSSVKIRSLVLFYPILNVSGVLNPTNKKEFGKGYGFDSRLWESYISAYKGTDIAQTKTLPATLLISAGKDIIINDEKEFSSKRSQVRYVEFEGAIHGFITDGHQKAAFKKAVELADLFLTK